MTGKWNQLNPLSGVSRGSRSASFFAITAIRLVMEPSTGSALRRKQKGRPSIAGGTVGRSTTRTLFWPGPRRELVTGRRASPAMALAHLDGAQPRKATPPPDVRPVHHPKEEPRQRRHARRGRKGTSQRWSIYRILRLHTSLTLPSSRPAITPLIGGDGGPLNLVASVRTGRA